MLSPSRIGRYCGAGANGGEQSARRYQGAFKGGQADLGWPICPGAMHSGFRHLRARPRETPATARV